MSLYDDFDTIKSRNTEKVAGWSSGIKLLQSQLQLKKAATTQPKRDSIRKSTQLPPVIDLKSKQKDEEDIFATITPTAVTKGGATAPTIVRDYDWDVVGEYDPMWPNDYDKVVKEIREQREKENSRYDDRVKFEDRTDRKRRSRFVDDEDAPDKQVRELKPMPEEEEEAPTTPRRSAGAAIAPPPSLQESTPLTPPHSALEKPGNAVGGYGGSSIAAKIMAKYGFKEGQGLGKKEQGMSVALQVEKTSKRGGRIIHEKDDKGMPPPPSLLPSADENPGAGNSPGNSNVPCKPEPTITEIMKSPSKVVLLRNMVGPGDVDEELEPEVKDECNTKYGDVIKVIIYELPNNVPEEAVRIFVEFKRIESAIKAVVDLNGRFFGGRQVRAGFYTVERFNTLQLLD